MFGLINVERNQCFKNHYILKHKCVDLKRPVGPNSHMNVIQRCGGSNYNIAICTLFDSFYDTCLSDIFLHCPRYCTSLEAKGTVRICILTLIITDVCYRGGLNRVQYFVEHIQY